MGRYPGTETFTLLTGTALLILLLLAVYISYIYIFSWIRKKAARTASLADDYIADLFRYPVIVFILWFLLNIFIRVIYNELPFYGVLIHIANLILIFSLTWLSIQFISAVAYYLQSRYDIDGTPDLQARKSLTQIKVFRTITVTLIVIIAVGAALMTFEGARKIGVSVLTSAGIIGLIVGFAAQKSLGMILAGMQLAITQPIRLDDLVTIEGEFGKIEEITLTYVVVKVWDERRMILPVTWFLEKPFMNWTRSETSTTGTITLYVDYSFPVDSLRNILPVIIKDNDNWDGRTAAIQVTGSAENHMELRILLSSSDSGKNWDLRTDVREKMIEYINANFPDAFAKIRIKTV